MPFNFRNLDAATREGMVAEIRSARESGNLYFSKRFTNEGSEEWPDLLLNAAREHDEHWLAFQLESRGLMKGLEPSATPSGGYTIKHVPHTAAETMAEGQFNRYYMLGLCRRASAEGIQSLTVYRAKEVADPRPDSEALVGSTVDPDELSEEIRPVDGSLRHRLLRPNSGLSVHL